MTQWILGDPSRCPPKHPVRLDAGRQFPQCWARARCLLGNREVAAILRAEVRPDAWLPRGGL